MRTLVGFGLGGSEVRTRVQVYQGAGPNAKLVGEAETNTRGSLKPGMGVLLPVGAAAGTVATTAVVAGGTTITSEAFFATVEADAKRTAEAVAKRIGERYRQQGWTSR
jgi:hydrogenase maturation factor HypE